MFCDFKYYACQCFDCSKVGIVGFGNAMELSLTGRRFSSSEGSGLKRRRYLESTSVHNKLLHLIFQSQSGHRFSFTSLFSKRMRTASSKSKIAAASLPTPISQNITEKPDGGNTGEKITNQILNLHDLHE